MHEIVSKYHIFIIHSSVDVYFGCFYILGRLNRVAKNTDETVSLQLVAEALEHMPRSSIVRSNGRHMSSCFAGG